MRTTLNIDDELLKDAKIAAIRCDSTLTAFFGRCEKLEQPRWRLQLPEASSIFPAHNPCSQRYRY